MSSGIQSAFQVERTPCTMALWGKDILKKPVWLECGAWGEEPSNKAA